MFPPIVRHAAHGFAVLAALTGLTFPANPLGDAVWWSLDSGPFAQSPRDVLTEASPVGAVRTFGNFPGTDATVAAQRTVDALDDDGGFGRRVLVVAVPTGSGWVSPEQVEAVERRYDGDVATVAVRYSSAPSAAVLLMHSDLAEASARALLTEVATRLRAMPVEHRPALVVQGLSLGAKVGASVLAGDNGLDRMVSARLWQGMPGGGPVTQDPCTVTVVNDDDPVGKLRPDLWLHPVETVGVLKELPGSDSLPAGTGHSYRPVLPPERCVSGDAGANTVSASRTPAKSSSR